MNPELISRVVGLVQKNGDKVVLADPVSGRAVVVMDLEVYERMLHGANATAPASIPAPVLAPTPAPEPVAIAPTAAPVPAASVGHAFRPQQITPPAPPLAGPVSAEQIASAFGIPASRKQHQQAEVPAAPPVKKGIKVTPETMGTPHVMADLTQEQLIDKINRDIGAWKNAQERRHTDELKAAVQEKPMVEPENALEDEERFFLEPIE